MNGTQSTTVIHSAGDADCDPLTVLVTNGGGVLGIEVKDTYGGSQDCYFNYFAAAASA